MLLPEDILELPRNSSWNQEWLDHSCNTLKMTRMSEVPPSPYLIRMPATTTTTCLSQSKARLGELVHRLDNRCQASQKLSPSQSLGRQLVMWLVWKVRLQSASAIRTPLEIRKMSAIFENPRCPMDSHGTGWSVSVFIIKGDFGVLESDFNIILWNFV